MKTRDTENSKPTKYIPSNMLADLNGLQSEVFDSLPVCEGET